MGQGTGQDPRTCRVFSETIPARLGATQATHQTHPSCQAGADKFDVRSPIMRTGTSMW